jgi:hypothetical protein
MRRRQHQQRDTSATSEPPHVRPRTNSLETACQRPRYSRSRQPVCHTRYNPLPSKPRLSRLLRLAPQSTAVFFTTSLGGHAIHHARSARAASSLPRQRHSSHPTARDDETSPASAHARCDDAPTIFSGPRPIANRDVRPTPRLPRTGKVNRNCANRARHPHPADPRAPESVLGTRFGLIQPGHTPMTSGIRRGPCGYWCRPHIYRIRVSSLEYEFSRANPLAGGMAPQRTQQSPTVRKHPFFSSGTGRHV